MLFGGAAKQFEQPILEGYPNVDIVALGARDLAIVDCSDVDCVVGWRFPSGMFGQMTNLKWIQSIAVGVDDWVHDSTIAPGVVITNTKGLYDDAVAEYIVWAAMTVSRKFHAVMRNQQKRRWRQLGSEGLIGKTIGIAGMGYVGRATAVCARALGMKVVGIFRRPDDADMSVPIDSAVGMANIDAILGELDVLAVCLPLTDGTRGLFSKERIARLKQGAIVINVAREAIFDYAGLEEAVRKGRLSGVALDVFDREPLPRRSSLWKADNILITPHISAITTDYRTKVARLICTNLQKLYSGVMLDGLVDRDKGY